MAKKLQRYHKDVYFPDWANHYLAKFFDSLIESDSLLFTIHAVERITFATSKYGMEFRTFLLKSIRNFVTNDVTIFEFYASEREIKKVCMRFSFEEYPIDIVLVITYQGIVLTVYTTRKGDSHESLDVNLYEKGES